MTVGPQDNSIKYCPHQELAEWREVRVHRRLTFGAPGTIPAGGDTILVIITGTRGCGFNLTIITGDGVIVIDIP